MIQAFAYEIRHSFMDAQGQIQQGKPTLCSIKMIWPDIIIYLMCMREKAASVSLMPQHLEVLDQLENQLKDAMYEYGPKVAPDNEHLVQPIFDLNNDFLFLLQHDLHNAYINTKPRRTGFNNLSPMMHNFLDNMGIQIIEDEAKRLAKKHNCSIRDLKSSDEYLPVKRW